MSWRRRLLNVFRKKRLARDLERELEFHIAERTDDLRASGMSAAAAEREARRRFGNYLLQKERTRDADVLMWADTLTADVRYALRALRANPAFALVAIVTLALGIGATTAIFGLIDAVILRALPVREPEELVAVTLGDEGDAFSNPLWEELRDRQDVFAGVAAINDSEFNLANGGEARRVPGNQVSGGYFGMLGVKPVLGRLIGISDDYRGCPGIAVLSAGFWQSEYGGARDVLGRTISLQGQPFEIVGVADPAFSGVTVGRASQVYVPLCTQALIEQTQATLDQRNRWWLRVLGRPRAGLTLPAVQARLAALAPAAYAATVPTRRTTAEEANYRNRTFAAEPARGGFSAVRERYGGPLRVLLLAVGAVLLIACANVANLLLARATARQPEMAVRLAIGAGRTRIVRQLLTESLVLSFISALAGVGIAWWSSRALVNLISDRDSVVLHLPLDSRMLGFTALVATAAAFLFGIAPAWRAGRSDPHLALRGGGRGVIRGAARFGAGKSLVVGQIALSLALVIVAGLLLSTLRALWTTHPGFDRERILLMDVGRARVAAPDDAGEPANAQRIEQERVVYDALLERLRTLPDVVSASASQITPMGRVSWNDFVSTPGFEPVTPLDAIAFVNEVTDGFFATLGTPLLVGRDFDERDRLGTTRVAIVNETMARKFFGTTSALGKQFALGELTEPRYEVIGVVGNTRYQSLREEPVPIAYLARSQATEPPFAMTFEIRTATNPETLIAAAKQVAAEVEPSMTLQFATLREQVAHTIGRERMLAVLSSAFGALALLLAVIGLYGIMTYNVARRRNEIGIRIALGSERSRLIRMILGEVGWLLAVGLALGTALAVGGSRLVASFLFGLSPNDPATMLGAALLFVLVGLAAGAIPAWRATRVEPMAALRQE